MCEGAVMWREDGNLLGVAEEACMLSFIVVVLGFFSLMGVCAKVAAEIIVMLVEDTLETENVLRFLGNLKGTKIGPKVMPYLKGIRVHL